MEDKLNKLLVIVESPLQLVNANELIKNFQDKPIRVELVVLSSRNVNNFQQIIKCIKVLRLDADIKEVFIKSVEGNPIHRWRFYAKVIRLARVLRKKEYDQVIVGHIKSIYQTILAQSARTTRYTFLDDGTSTITEQNQLKKKKLTTFFPWYKRIFVYGIGLNPNIPYSINGKLNFFTAYNSVIEKNHPYLTYQANEFLHLKKEYLKKEVNSKLVFFIGSPFYWEDEKNSQMDLVFEKLKKRFQDYEVYYFPHRYEGESTKNLIKQIGWKLVRPELPIEVNLITFDKIASTYAMFTSSVFYSLESLLPEDSILLSFMFDKIDYLKNGSHLRNIYADYERHKKIKVIKI